MFTSLINRSLNVHDWQKIPWHDPDFSRRMLAEHLSQTHDLASRRQSIIDEQVNWIQHKILKERPAKILDLGCGPGFYSHRFSALGHVCTGLDFSPASIDYARDHHPGGQYVLGDIRELDFGSGYDLVTLIYGELNAFAAEDAARIVNKAYQALETGGTLLLEVHPAEIIYQIGHQAASWHTAEKGLFSDDAYLCLTESRYEVDRAITYHYVYAAATGEMQRYVNMLQGYSNDEYRQMLRDFKHILFYPSLTGDPKPANLFVIAAEK